MFKAKVLNLLEFDKNTVILTTTKPADYSYLAGQHTRLTIPHANPDNRGEFRDFSFASSPSEETLEFISRIPDIHSTYKRAMKNLKRDDEIFVGDPKGYFLLPENSSSPMVWLAAGVGIAPFRSFIKSGQSFSGTTLFYTNPTDNFAYIGEFKYINIVKNNSKILGHFTPETFSSCSKTALYYLCGNTGFILSIQQVLLKLGIKPSQLRKDVFTGY